MKYKSLVNIFLVSSQLIFFGVLLVRRKHQILLSAVFCWFLWMKIIENWKLCQNLHSSDFFSIWIVIWHEFYSLIVGGYEYLIHWPPTNTFIYSMMNALALFIWLWLICYSGHCLKFIKIAYFFGFLQTRSIKEITLAK